MNNLRNTNPAIITRRRILLFRTSRGTSSSLTTNTTTNTTTTNRATFASQQQQQQQQKSFKEQFLNLFKEKEEEETHNNTTKSSNTKYKYTLSSIAENMSALHQLLRSSSEYGVVVDHNNNNNKLRLGANELIRRLRVGIKEGSIVIRKNPSTVSNVMADAMSLIASSSTNTNNNNNNNNNNDGSKYREALHILKLLQAMRLDVTPSHYHAVIQAACSEEKYDEAARLFYKQLDDFAGYVPMDANGEALSNALYAVAKAEAIKYSKKTKERSIRVSRAVMNIARRLSIVSPMDTDGFTCAAISTLGKVGEWKESLMYLNTKEGREIGYPLIASAMEACLYSKRWKEAILLFENYNKNKIENDAFDSLHTRIESLALEAYSMASSADNKMSTRSRKLYFDMITKKDTTDVKFDAKSFERVTIACEKDKDWASLLYMSCHHFASTPLSSTNNNTILPRLVLNISLPRLLRICLSRNDPTAGILCLIIARDLILDNNSIVADENLIQNDNNNCNTCDAWKLLESSLLESFRLNIDNDDNDGNDDGNITALVTSVLNLFRTTHSNSSVEQQSFLVEINRICRNWIARPIVEEENDDKAQNEKYLKKLMQVSEMGNRLDIPLILLHLKILVSQSRVSASYNIDWTLFEQETGLLPESWLSSDKALDSLMSYLVARGKDEIASQLFLDAWYTFSNKSNNASYSRSIENFIDIVFDMKDPKVIEFEPQIMAGMMDMLLKKNKFSRVLDVWSLARDYNIVTDQISLLCIEAISRMGWKNGGRNKSDMYINVSDYMDIQYKLEPGEWLRKNTKFFMKNLPQKEKHKLMGWNAREARREEFMACHSIYLAMKYGDEEFDASFLTCILDNAGYKQRFQNCRGKPIGDYSEEGHSHEFRQQQKDRDEGIRVILDTIKFAERKSVLNQEPSILTQAAQGLRALKGQNELISLVKSLSSKGIHLKQKVFLHAIAASKDAHDLKSEMDMIKLMERAGYEYKSQ